MALFSFFASLLCSLFGILCSTPSPTPQPSLRPSIAPATSPGGGLSSLVFSSQATLFNSPCDCNLALLFRTGDLSDPVTLSLVSSQFYPELEISPSPIVIPAGQSSTTITVCSSNSGIGFCGLTARLWRLRFEGPGGLVQSNYLDFETPDFTTIACNSC